MAMLNSQRVYIYTLYISYWLVVSTHLKNMKVRLDHNPNYWGK